MHDKAYDRAHVSGFMGVLTSTSTIGADYTLVAQSFGLSNFPTNLMVSPTEQLEGVAVGTFIGIVALPKAIFYGFAIAGEALKN
jgi:hypothetical protein